MLENVNIKFLQMKVYLSNFKRLVNNLLIVIIIFTGGDLIGQEETIGLLHYDDNTSEGYILFTPSKNVSTYLINNCGEVINEWTFSELPGATCYLLQDGSLLRAGKDSLEIRDWESNLVWSYATTNNGIKQHHDIEPLPNGNILCVVGTSFTKDEIIALGRDPENVSNIFRMDKILELEPYGQNNANIVWEWRFQDHLIQEFDSSKPNYGMVIEHPELIDLNYINSDPGDFTHVNAVDYNTELDQVLITSRHLSEIFIIDHSTTTEEAAGHSGGNSGLGGDLMWRWGNLAGYQQGSTNSQKLFMPHDAKWVESDYLDEGKISIFNNGGDLDNNFSFIHLIEPIFANGNYPKEDSIFLPLDYDWSWHGLIIGDTVKESSKSGMMSLPNGNVELCESSKGRFSEITKTGDLLMTYVNPVGDEIFNQFDILEINDNTAFRVEKYPTDYSGFEGKDMNPKGIIEDFNSTSENCSMLQFYEELDISVVKVNNPVIDNRVRFDQYISNTDISITDINGHLLFELVRFNGNYFILTLPPSLYIMQLRKRNKKQIFKLIVQ